MTEACWVKKIAIHVVFLFKELPLNRPTCNVESQKVNELVKINDNKEHFSFQYFYHSLQHEKAGTFF